MDLLIYDGATTTVITINKLIKEAKSDRTFITIGAWFTGVAINCMSNRLKVKIVDGRNTTWHYVCTVFENGDVELVNVR